MKININSIKGSRNPIRTSEDKEKMDELVQSIAQQGLIVPIKVRPLGDEYEVVYGHRRLHACKELGLAEIECIVEGMEEGDQLVQALIENVIREDMNDADKGESLRSIRNITGKTWKEIGKMFGHGEGWASKLAGLSDIESEFIKTFAGATLEHVQQVTAVIKDEPTRKQVFSKIGREDLSKRQARRVADAVAQSETPEERKAILETPIDNPVFDRIVRAKAKAEIEHKAAEAERHMGNTQEVKEFLDAMKAFEKAISIIMEAIDYKAISPESVQYTVNRLAKVTESINDLTIKLMEAE